MISLDAIDRLTGRRLGTFDFPCPLCSPFRKPANQRKLVLRIWRVEFGFATYHCVHCGEHGPVLEHTGKRPHPARLAKARAEAAALDRATKAQLRDAAKWLWSRRRPISGTIAERYLRDARGYDGPIPATLGFLPARGEYPPAMIGAFGLAQEVGHGELAVADAAVCGVHLTRLLPDGSGKAVFDDPDEQAKIMIGHSAGWPLVLAPPNDLLGVTIAEGIEDALSVHLVSGLGAWAAGCASRLPALAAAVPGYVECVTLLVDDDRDGRRHAGALAERLIGRGIEVQMIVPAAARKTAV
jgi:hypothetical protein